jgi:hypothetical protein
MTFDPYTNRIVQGLLTDEEKAALLATGGPWKCRDPRDNVWELTDPAWLDSCVYRAVRKSLPVPQEGDIWVHPNYGYSSIIHGQDSRDMIRKGWRLFREVKA